MTYFFKCKYGEIRTKRVNMELIREVGSKWAIENHEPQPPMKRPRFFREDAKEMLAIKKELGISRSEAIEEWRNRQDLVKDFDNTEYKKKLLQWGQRRLHIQATEMIIQSVVIDGLSLEDAIENKIDLSILAKIRSDRDVFRDLYFHILEISELTESAVMRAIESLEYKWRQKPLLEWVNEGKIPKGYSSSSWTALGYMAAKETSKMPPYQFRKIEIPEQAEIVAIYLAESWIKSLRAEEEKVKREQERNRSKPTR